MKRAWIVVAGVGCLAAFCVYRATRQVDHADAGYRALRAGNNAEAIEELRLAVKAEPDLAAAHYDLGSAYENVGWIDQALPELERAYVLKPNDETYRQGLAQTRRTLGYRAQREQRWADALKLYQGVNSLVGDDAKTWYNLALVLQKVSRNEDAKKAIDRANELDPGHDLKLPDGG